MNKNLDKPNLKYIYNGVSLRSWCESTGVNYSKICYLINKHRRAIGSELNVDDAVFSVMKNMELRNDR